MVENLSQSQKNDLSSQEILDFFLKIRELMISNMDHLPMDRMLKDLSALANATAYSIGHACLKECNYDREKAILMGDKLMMQLLCQRKN